MHWPSRPLLSSADAAKFTSATARPRRRLQAQVIAPLQVAVLVHHPLAILLSTAILGVVPPLLAAVIMSIRGTFGFVRHIAGGRGPATLQGQAT